MNIEIHVNGVSSGEIQGDTAIRVIDHIKSTKHVIWNGLSHEVRRVEFDVDEEKYHVWLETED
jgi:hypothetical protein